MSASLVGSDMCIRDRQSTSAGPAQAALQNGAEHCQGQDQAPRVGPVSYTHLTLPTICSV
eukprot:4268762-Alexandrium_andersonii.AAC.1